MCVKVSQLVSVASYWFRLIEIRLPWNFMYMYVYLVCSEIAVGMSTFKVKVTNTEKQFQINNFILECQIEIKLLLVACMHLSFCDLVLHLSCLVKVKFTVTKIRRMVSDWSFHLEMMYVMKLEVKVSVTNNRKKSFQSKPLLQNDVIK